MTPKEKAKELVFKYDFLQAVIEAFRFYDSKKCALIAVDEIIKSNPCKINYEGLGNCSLNDNSEYWIEVKKEIEIL
jgi:hypothetical protein